MRPLRSFLLLLIFLSIFYCFGYLVTFVPGLPGLSELIQPVTINTGSDSVHYPLSLSPSGSQGLSRGKDSAVTHEPVVGSSAGKPSRQWELNARFDSLLSGRDQVRIMYYGDSQIEGDRISSSLRRSLQERMGGTGPGLFLPKMPVIYTRSLSVKSTSNWEKYNYLSFRNGEISTASLGPFMAVCRYLPPGKKSDSPVDAGIVISPSIFAGSSAAKYETLRIFYGNLQGEVFIRISEDGKVTARDTLAGNGGVNEFSCRLSMPREIRIDFMGKTSPDIYGISIESSKGIILDNIPLRGSAGLEFTMTDRKNLEEIYDILEPQLVIHSFGLNIVKNLSSDYGYYEEGLFRQLVLLKELIPGALIVVMGITDMAYMEGDTIRSYPNITEIRDAQMNAAQRAGALFWDSREAMGGELSVVRWAKQTPPLAQNDYVHLTSIGADSIAAMFFGSCFGIADTPEKEAAGKPLNSQPEYLSVNPARADGNRVTVTAIVNTILSYNPESPFIFTTPGFWIFMLVVLAGYSMIYRVLPLRNIYLLIVSLYFYFKAGGFFLLMLVFITVTDYICGILINRQAARPGRRFFLLLSIFSNLGLLAYFKYAAFITESVNALFGTDIRVYDLLSAFSNSVLGTSFDTSFIILPVGISFFTFQSLSYTIDVYRRNMEPVRNIIDFGFYVSFFPQLVAGPIVRASTFMPQVRREYSLSRNEFSHALFMITKGLVKKIVISNFIALNFVDRVFDAPAVYSGFENLMAIYGYGLQIYCDFSGYTDIAIGVALILGFRLPVNFNSPYKAASVTDFWKRWHISLSRWLKDYLYIPLGGNRKGMIRTYANLMITMLLGGLWHGAALKFIIWGGLHGAGLVAGRIRESLFPGKGRVRWPARVAGILVTFHFVSFCWIFFRAGTLNDALIMMGQIWESFSPGNYTEVLSACSSVLVVIVTGYIIHFLPERIKESYRGFFIGIPIAAQMAVIMVIAFALYQLRTTDIMPFIYFRF